MNERGDAGDKTCRDWLQAARQQIDALDARLLLQHVTGFAHADLICRPDAPLGEATTNTLEALVKRRAAGEPLAYLTGEAGFRGHRFKVTPAVLTPRPETEELVDRALEKLAELGAITPCPKVLDLGTGSGVIPICIALESPDAQVFAVDLSPEALRVAQENGERLGVSVFWRQGDWFAALAADERFHLVLANPPYIAADDPHLAGDGLRFEPRLALTDEADGLTALKRIIAAAPAHLEAGGWLLLEHGGDQGNVVRVFLTQHGFRAVTTWNDLSGHERVSGGQAMR